MTLEEDAPSQASVSSMSSTGSGTAEEKRPPSNTGTSKQKRSALKLGNEMDDDIEKKRVKG